MNTTDQLSPDLMPDLDEQLEGGETHAKPEISGYDSGTRPLFSQPTLYLSIAVVFIVALVSLSNSPFLFWTSFIGMSALALIFHVLAERIIFKGKTEFAEFAAPFEGVFVVTFGSLLPGLGLLAYGVYAMSSSPSHQSIVEDIGKMALLLVVPIFNYGVWSAISKGYLIRPRLTGLMSGLALGLSVSWAAIFVKFLLAPADGACKFGWMLLMCVSPFLLISALSLSVDLWHKTEPGMRRITTAFSVMGILLSGLFVFAPMVRTFSIQSLINDARQSPSEAQAKAVASLRSLATSRDLRPSKYPVSGFNLAELLISGRGLDSGTPLDRDLYFKITGAPYADTKATDSNQSQINPLVGSKIAGLSLLNSQFSGNVDSQSLSSSIDWTMTFCNMSSATQEARAEIGLPKGAVVTRVTLWKDGEPLEARFLPSAKAQTEYNSSASKDLLLVTMPAAERILLQCFPVPADRRAVKARLEFKVPLEIAEGKSCAIELPNFVDTNFSVPKRHQVSITSGDVLVKSVDGVEQSKKAERYLLDGIIKTDNPRSITSLLMRRSKQLTEFATPDAYAHDKRFIVQRLEAEQTTRSPKRLFMVIDPSASMKASATEIRDALSSLAIGFQPTVIFAATPEPDKVQKDLPATSIKQALIQLNAETFEGGQDNGPALRQALETAAERPNSAVIWIHGPQPIAQKPDSAETTPLELVRNVCLYDLQTETQTDKGSAPVLETLHMEDPSNQMHYVSVHHESISKDVKALISGWKNGTTQFVIKRTIATSKPETTVLTDPAVSAQVTGLWAKEEFERLEAKGQSVMARKLASDYRLVTPTTGAIVLEKSKVNPSRQMPSGELKAEPTAVSSASGGGMVGAPVDPRYGQSNEVGMMADFGYDKARDICRILTAVSMLLSIIVAAVFVRSRPKITSTIVWKGIALVLVVPLIVHLMGTFMINNFGGLGGGL